MELIDGVKLHGSSSFVVDPKDGKLTYIQPIISKVEAD